jgi:outer membrane protein OmpA-like peptidoglycan-associated protein
MMFWIWMQAEAQKVVIDHYTVSAGVLGAANFSEFRMTGNSSAFREYSMEASWSAGVWINFPFANSFSLEPQFLYSSYRYKTEEVSHLLLNDGTIHYFSAPLHFKFHMGRKVALAIGPQYDYLHSVEDNGNSAQKSNFTESSFSVFGGLELYPHDWVTVFGRYLYGLTNMDRTDPTAAVKYYNQVIQAGLKIKLFGKRIPADSDGDGIIDANDKCPMLAGLERYAGCPVPDSDKDGINDEEDRCPNQPGVARYEGCPVPDTDKDGINDEEDKCPNQAGFARYQGCPVPDTDKDGIDDEQDKCPTQPGSPKYSGCPVPDTDGDGINDEEDRCPDQPGVPEMKGCPRIQSFEAHKVTFAKGKWVLTEQGKSELDIVVAFIKRLPSVVKVSLVGHTDNTGSDQINDPLSVARAEAAKKYLVNKGVEESRITTEGKGSRNPVADNKTAQGRAMNRRVEVIVQ